MATSSIKHKATLSTVRIVKTPQPHIPFTAISEHGQFWNLRRLRTESNVAYKNRLQQVFPKRANSTYNGLVYGITRELGLDLSNAIFINPKLNSDSSFVATDPFIEFDGVYLNLYSDYQNGTLEVQLDRYEKGGHYEYYKRLIDRINKTTYFEAGLHPDADEWTRSMTILNQHNRKEVEAEDIPVSTKFRLQNERICPSTVFFSNRAVFATEKDNSASVANKGDYHIDYQNGIVTVATLPPSGTWVRYWYTVYPFLTISSPIIINSISDDNFKPKMFDQILQDDGTYTNGKPNELGVDIINELISKYPEGWGE